MVNETASEKVIVKPYEETDFEGFLRVQEESPLSRSFDREEIEKSVRASMQKTSCEFFSVFEKETGDYCGFMELHCKENCQPSEFGITLLAEKQNRGLGTAAIRVFCSDCFYTRGIKTLLVRIEAENTRSRHVFEKLGAKWIGKTLHPGLIKLCQELGQPIPDAEKIGANTFLLDLPLAKDV